MAAEKDPHAPSSEPRPAGPELRLLDRRAFVGFPPLDIAPGVRVTDFALQIPDVTFPFNVTGGPQRYQNKKLQFGYLDVSVDAEQVQRRIAVLASHLVELEELKLHFRPGYLEGQVRLKTADRTPVTFKVAFDGDGERLAVYVYDIRLFGFSATPASQVPVLLSRALQAAAALPEIELRGATGFFARVLPPLAQAASVARGYKVPFLEGARLSAADVSPQGLKLRFAAGGLPPPSPPDEELMLTLEGARAFSDAEELLARGKLAEARDAYLRLGDIQDAHPFAAERLLTLLVADPQAHEMALDVASSVLRRRERSATALWSEAVVRERRGESARAAERYLSLCGLSRRSGEEAAAFFAAESAARAARDQAPQMAVKALHELLGLRPDHLPSLKALARAADQANDRAGAARAYRRIAALARDPGDAAEAHVHLARLSAVTEDDVAGARLHCEAALRLAPDHPEALYLLGELCHRSGEHLRALKALDRLRDVGLGRHELERVGRAHLLAGQVWEAGLGQLENALLRYRESVALLPHAPEPLFRMARVAEALGRAQEALAGYQQAVELAGPSPQNDDVRRAAHAAHHALARLYRMKLQDPVQARSHLEAALALDATDRVALGELIPAFRAGGRAADLADALEKAAAIADEQTQRAAALAEAGELYRSRLGQPEKAERLLNAAVEADPRQRLALEGLLALAEARRDGGPLARSLKALAELAVEPKDRARYLRRLAVTARDLTFDLELAAYALTEVLKLEPEDLAALGELCVLQRKRGDVSGLAAALEQRARAAEGHRDFRLAGAALRELAQVLEARLGRVGEALVALEKAARLAPDAGVLSDLADLSLRCERPEHARRALEDLLALLPKHAAPERIAEVRARLGRACEQLGDRAAARRHYAEAFPLRRLDDALAARLEVLYAEDGAEADLGELWASRADALLAAGRADAAAPLLLRSADALMRIGQKDAALVKLNAALDAAPEGALAGDILERMAEVALQVGTPLDAAKLYARRAGLLRDARQAAALFWKAATLALGTPREEAYLEETLAKEPDFLPARARRAERLLEAAPARALEELERILSAPPSHPQAPSVEERALYLRRAADAAARAGQPERALSHLARYAAEHPADLAAQRELASLLRREGHDEALCDLLGELWPRLPGAESETACHDFCELALVLQREAEALEALRFLLKSPARGAWAARTLLKLLPLPRAAGDEARERLLLLTRALEEPGAPPSREWLLERAELNELLGNRSQARADYQRAAGQEEKPAALWAKVASLSQALGEVGDELAAWEKALAHDPNLGAVVQPRLLSLATERLIARDAPRAQVAFRLLSSLPLSPDARQEVFFGLAEAARLSGDTEAAAQALGEAARAGPTPRRVSAYLEQAALWEVQGRWPENTRALEAAIRLSPGHPQATQALLRALRAQEDWSGLAELMAAQARHLGGPAGAALYEELAHLYLDVLNQPGPASAAFARVAALDPQRHDIQRTLARLAVDRGALNEAVDHAQRAASGLPPIEGASLLREIAEACHQTSEGELARALWRKAHALRPASGAQLAEWAVRLFEAGAWAEALPMLEAAARTDLAAEPEIETMVLEALAEVCASRGDREGAEAALLQLQRARPDDPWVIEQLAEIYWEDRPREAVRLLRELAGRLRHGGRAAGLLIGAAERVRRELSDVDLASELLAAAAEVAFEPLPVRQARVELLRDAGRTPELLTELSQVAALLEARGDEAGALAAHLEVAELAESSGRVEEALRTLEEVREQKESRGQLREAAQVERRRAELLRDGRHDLDAAESALERSDALHADVDTAKLGAAMARSRRDTAAEAKWLERAVARTEGKERARWLSTLARAVAGEQGWPDRADAAAREALALDPSLREVEKLLIERLEEAGRLPELASYFEDAAAAARAPQERVALLVRAADVYALRMGRPDAAASALLAAHATAPDDQALTARAADVLHAAGRTEEAAEFDALLLESNPFHPTAARHLAYLQAHADHPARAGLMLKRAAAQSGPEAAQSYLAAAEDFRASSASEQALLCEDQAFAHDPASTPAFEAVRARQGGDARRLAEVLEKRARAVPAEAEGLLRERAQKLLDAGEELLAAAALDELLALTPADPVALRRRGDLAAKAAGPAASQPYDRRVLSLEGEGLAPAVRAKLQLRLGHAALLAGALRDAADAFEAVVALEPEGPRGDEALSLLAEVHARTQNVPGLYRTTLARARHARADEAEALLRRAAGLFAQPEQAVEAWEALAVLRPAEEGVVAPASAALRALGRWSELVDLLERSAQAIGGGSAAQRFLEAAELAEKELGDDARARALKTRAVRSDPDNPAALRAVVEEARHRGDARALREALERLLPKAADQDEEALWRLELASAAKELGDEAAARHALWPVVRWGRSATGYTEALRALLPILDEAGDPRAFVDVLTQLAEISQGPERASLLLRAGDALERLGDAAGAVRLTQASVSGQPSKEGFNLLARLYQSSGEKIRAGEALRQAARLAQGSERGLRLLAAADVFESAGEKAEARECAEEAAAVLGDALPPLELAARLSRLGAAAQAVWVGFEPALRAGELALALRWADDAQDASRIRAVLAQEALEGKKALAQARLQERIAAQDAEGTWALADTLEEAQANDVATEAREALLFGPLQAATPARLRPAIFERLERTWGIGPLLSRALERGPSDPEWLDWLVGRARGAGAEIFRSFIPRIVGRLPARREALLLELADLHEEAGDLGASVETLASLGDSGPPERVGPLQLRLGILFERLGDEAQARAAFERALIDPDSASVAAGRLLPLAAPAGARVLLEAVGRVEAAGQGSAVRPHLAALADAYESAGKLAEAARTLAELEPTHERLERRAHLADALGLSGEALTLREQITEDPRALENILLGYLVRDLHPQAVRLVQRLQKEGALSPRSHRAAAERLSRTPEGASLACALWRPLLRERPADVDGWTLFAEALRRAGQPEAAARADGLGAALSSSADPAPMNALRPLARPPVTLSETPPPGSVAMSTERMPRLAGALQDALTALGAPDVRVWLDAGGGPEAYLLGARTLVLGAGTLALFGSAELAYLCALALALADEGVKLRDPGPVAALPEAAAQALRAAPSTLAACRVAAALDGSVRGAEPHSYELGAVLRSSDVFAAIARAALDLE